MADPLSRDAFYQSARDCAQRALQAHHARESHRVALEAGTTLEHLAKACLVRRSPALLIELGKGEGSFGSLLRLLEIPEGVSLRELRTVSLRGALDRMRTFVKAGASEKDIKTLIDMRDGTVHAALDYEVEERLLVAFVKHADALLADLEEHRDDFWTAYRPVVDALLKDAGNKVAHEVEVMLEAARANFHRRFGHEPEEILEVFRRMAEIEDRGDDQVSAVCPACESPGTVTGFAEVVWEPRLSEGQAIGMDGTVWLVPQEFECHVCGLLLDDPSQVEAAGLDEEIEIKGADPRKYEAPPDEDSLYEAWRESRYE
jgi:hypothetical protein